MNARTPWLVFGLSIGVTIFAALLTDNLTNEFAKERFEVQAEETIEAIKVRFDAYEQVLSGAKGLFVASDDVTREEWKQFVEAQGASERFPGIQGIGYSKFIGGKDNLESHIEKIRGEGFPEYEVKPEGDREEYHSIIYLEPFDERNKRAFGYDMYSEPTRRAAMSMARDSGITTLSGKVTLVQEITTDVQAGFLLYVPLYAGGTMPQTVEERRDSFAGFVYSPFRMNDFMEGILGATQQDITFVVCDSTPDPQNLMYDYSAVKMIKNDEVDDSITKTVVLDIKQRQWVVKFTALKSIHYELETLVLSMVLITGISFSILIFFILRSNAKLIRLTQESLKNEKMATIGEMSSRLAHDLKNPLTAIKNSVELIEFHQKGKVDERLADYFKIIKESTFRMKHQLEDVMDYVKTKPPMISNESTNEIIAAAVRTTPIPNNVKVVTPENDLTLQCDKKQLVVVLSNLIMNAAQAIEKNTGTITIRTSEDDDNTLIEIVDTGPGIKNNDLSKVFEPLFTTKQQGTGLGLVTCKNIVEQHGGTISANNNPTTFTIKIPKKRSSSQTKSE